MPGADAPRLVVAALPEELLAVKDVLGTAGASVVARVTGDGPRNAEKAAAAFLRDFRPEVLIGIGIAGSLSPELRRGDVVAGEVVLDDHGAVPPPSAIWLSASATAGAKLGTLVTVEHPVTSVERKRSLGSERAKNSIAVVDMESAAWGRAAASRGVPYVVVRVVADEIHHALPVFLESCLDEYGGIDRGRVARHAALRPWLVPSLLRLRRALSESAPRLEPVLAAMLREVPSR